MYVRVVLAVAGLCAIPALADWNHDVLWDQLDPSDGYAGASWLDYDTPSDALTADDFLCSHSGWITDVEFYGFSYHGSEYIDSFRLTFWSDVAATPLDAGKPGELLYDHTIGPVTDPTYPTLGWREIEPNHYKINLPENEWFAETGGNVYWIGIQAVMSSGSGYDAFYLNFHNRYAPTWGGDAAIQSDYFGLAPWWNWGCPEGYLDGQPYEGPLPAGWTSLDRSFRLTGMPEPTSLLLVYTGMLLLRRR